MPRARKLPADLETDPKKVLELLVGLPEVSVLGVDSSGPVVQLHVEKFADPSAARRAVWWPSSRVGARWSSSICRPSASPLGCTGTSGGGAVMTRTVRWAVWTEQDPRIASVHGWR